VQQLLNQGVPASALQRDALYTGGQYVDNLGNTVTFGPAVNNQAFDHILFQTAAASGNYNALQARVTELVGGLSLTAGYTYAHALDTGSDPLTPGAGNSGLPRDPANLASEYGNADFDVRHRGTVAATYDLPVGHGQHFLASGIMGRVFEGMEISGIQQVQTGLPFDLRGTVDNLHTSLNNRPQLIGKPYPSGRGQIVAGGKITGPSMSAFANAPFGEAVSIRRNKFYGPGLPEDAATARGREACPARGELQRVQPPESDLTRLADARLLDLRSLDERGGPERRDHRCAAIAGRDQDRVLGSLSQASVDQRSYSYFGIRS
jgi:hypothetical protein